MPIYSCEYDSNVIVKRLIGCKDKILDVVVIGIERNEFIIFHNEGRIIQLFKKVETFLAILIVPQFYINNRFVLDQ